MSFGIQTAAESKRILVISLFQIIVSAVFFPEIQWLTWVWAIAFLVSLFLGFFGSRAADAEFKQDTSGNITDVTTKGAPGEFDDAAWENWKKDAFGKMSTQLPQIQQTYEQDKGNIKRFMDTSWQTALSTKPQSIRDEVINAKNLEERKAALKKYGLGQYSTVQTLYNNERSQYEQAETRRLNAAKGIDIGVPIMQLPDEAIGSAFNNNWTKFGQTLDSWRSKVKPIA